MPILFLSLCPIVLHGQTSATPEKNEEKEHKSAKNMESVTGCLQKGDEPGGFSIIGDDGKMWELRSRRVKLARHVGHKVTVTGSRAHESKAKEEKMEKTEQKEAGGKEYGDLLVTGLKMISDSCK